MKTKNEPSKVSKKNKKEDYVLVSINDTNKGESNSQTPKDKYEKEITILRLVRIYFLNINLNYYF